MSGRTSPKMIRRNFMLRLTDSENLDELAKLIGGDDEEADVSRSKALRIAIREALDRRRDKPKKSPSR